MILQNIIETSGIPFPQGTTSAELFLLLDQSGEGVVTFDTFMLQLGRIYMGDSFQTGLILQMNQGMTRKLIHDCVNGLGRVETSLAEVRSTLVRGVPAPVFQA